MKQAQSKSKGRVRDVASAHPSAIDVTSSTKTAGEKLRKLGTRKFPVARGERLVGRIDDPNPDRAVARYGHDPEATAIGEMSIGEAIYCYEDQSPEEVRKIMVEQEIEHIPVVDRDLRILGIVSRKSLEAMDSVSTRKPKKRKAA